MRKTVETLWCDDCGQEIKNPRSSLHFPAIDRDLCRDCINERLQYTFDLMPVGRICPQCDGKGKEKDFYGHNDYNWVDCKRCQGKKTIGFHKP
jgi:hypothetical protein